MPSTVRVFSSISFRASPRMPISYPKLKFLDCEQPAVKTRSPRPHMPIMVPWRPPRAPDRRPISLSPRVISAARAPSPNSAPSITPEAMAITFFDAAADLRRNHVGCGIWPKIGGGQAYW